MTLKDWQEIGKRLTLEAVGETGKLDEVFRERLYHPMSAGGGPQTMPSLSSLILGERVGLDFGEHKRDQGDGGDGRLVARVIRERDGLDVGAELIRRGHAATWPGPAKE